MLFEVKNWKFATKAPPVAESAQQGQPQAAAPKHANSVVAAPVSAEMENSQSKKKRRNKTKSRPLDQRTDGQKGNTHTQAESFSRAHDPKTLPKVDSGPLERKPQNKPVKHQRKPTNVTKPNAAKLSTKARTAAAPAGQIADVSSKAPQPKRKHAIIADPSKSESEQDFKRNCPESSASTTNAELCQPSFGSTSGPMSKLQAKMASKLRGARFRWINEQLYTTRGEDAFALFQDQPEIFNEYHEGFQSQVKSWPTNPVDLYIKVLRKLPSTLVVADMGCGEAKIAQSVKQTVHSFDLVAANAHITACNIAHTPMPDSAVDIVIFCLSLMGTNYLDFLREARRIAKPNGQLWVAEVISRFTDIDAFIQVLDGLGFKLSVKDASNKMFILFEFSSSPSTPQPKRAKSVSSKASAPLLKPCIYKRR